ncbi:MAG: hypothetical protein AB1304_10570 [Bacteroidota bacterium]
MKKIELFYLIIMTIPFFAMAQQTINNDDGFTITEIIIKDSVPAKDLIARATAWAQKKTS